MLTAIVISATRYIAKMFYSLYVDNFLSFFVFSTKIQTYCIFSFFSRHRHDMFHWNYRMFLSSQILKCHLKQWSFNGKLQTRPRLTFEPKAAHYVHIVGRPTVILVKPLLIFKDNWGYFQPFLRRQNKETCRHLHKFNVSMACRNVQSWHFHLVTELDHLFF